MDDAEKKYQEELKAAGVELPEEPKEETPKDEPMEEEKKEETPESPKPEDKAPLQTPKEQPKRSIYDEYKEKKQELKSERELRETAERERDELKSRLEALDKAGTPEEKQEAADDLEAFAKEINADPAALKKMRDLFIKDAAPKTDPELAKRLEAFETWQKANSKALESQMFEQEFTTSKPKLAKLFPNASDAEMSSIKAELDKLSHTKDWHDKPLAYIAFENQETLGALVSPKKRGMESKERKEVDGEEETGFDPGADLSKMTDKQRETWEKEYRKLGKTEGLITDTQGRRILI